MTGKTTQRELAALFGINPAEVSKALYKTPGARSIRSKELIYDTAEALKAIRDWYMECRRYFTDKAEALETKANMARDELRRFEKGKDGGANG